MKKVAFFIIMVFALFAVSDTILAKTDTDYDTALKYYYSGNYKEAIRLFKEYVKKKPDSSAYYYIAYALYKIGEYDEANRYFKEAYLIDPMFSPVKPESLEKFPEQRIREIPEPSIEQVPLKQIPYVTETKEEQPEMKLEPVPERQPSKEIQPQKPPEPTVTLKEQPLPPEPPKVQPQQSIQPPAGFPPSPMPRKGMPGPPTELLTGLLAGFATIIIVLQIAMYLYFCLCLFLIAKKLDVSAPWTAWIPIIQVWTIVASAGKPWWWILLFLIPIVNIIVGIYVWLCITENLGRNKWLGLLMLLPIINFVFLGILAFSKAEKPGYAGVKVPA